MKSVVLIIVSVTKFSLAKINLGRIAALMSYCYHLCKEYITKNLISGTLIASFLGQVAGWLFQFLLKAKFYEWLNSHGGWVRTGT